ncbi:MAG: hypothetical protein U0W24_07860 [Bacteroidales bacterium]
MELSDYIKRQILEFAKSIEELLTKVEKNKKSGQFEEAIQQVDLGLLELLNRNIEELTNTPPESFLPGLLTETGINSKNLELMAKLFLETGRLFEHVNEKETAKRLYTRSLHIYQYLLKSEMDFPYERHLKIKELKELLLQ